jgi:ABC-type taurine transport system ATPase subunit
MLQARGLVKSYGGVVALSGADFTVRAGSVHALLGENGAGKSTLVKIIAGALKPDAGTVALDGRELSLSSTAEAVRHGIAVVSQELNVFPDLDVLSNLYPMREIRRGPFVQRGEMAARARPVLAELGLDVPLRTPVGDLSLAQRQLLEIVRAGRAEHRAAVRGPAGAARPPGRRRVRLAHPRGRDGAVRRGDGAARRRGLDGRLAACRADRADDRRRDARRAPGGRAERAGGA